MRFLNIISLVMIVLFGISVSFSIFESHNSSSLNIKFYFDVDDKLMPLSFSPTNMNALRTDFNDNYNFRTSFNWLTNDNCEINWTNNILTANFDIDENAYSEQDKKIQQKII